MAREPIWISIAYGRFMLVCWLTFGYFNIFQTLSTKKRPKMHFFWSLCLIRTK